jgi:hypothetical protein
MTRAEIFETVVLFTDIRGSSQLIRETPPQMFFQNLNGLLSAQAALVRNHQGAVVKYTGDGMMAVFRGMGRSYLALALRPGAGCPGTERTRFRLVSALPRGWHWPDSLVIPPRPGKSASTTSWVPPSIWPRVCARWPTGAR